MEQIINFDFWGIDTNEEFKKMAEKVVKECYKIEKITNPNLAITIIFTNPEKIREINNEYRKIDKATDVLSFPMFEKEEIEDIKNTETLEVLGDIILSIEQVEAQAKEYGHSFEREFSYMIVHGFYHLMGYDHIEEEDKKVMREKEEAVLEELTILRNF